MPHEGGAALQADEPCPAAGHAAPGSPKGCRTTRPTCRPCTKIEVLPGSRVLNAPARWQQLAVMAHFADGSVRDVTRLTVFSSSDTAVADVNANGLVEFGQRGEVAILCRYLDEMHAGPPHLPRAEEGLRLDQSAREQLRRQARLRQAEDARASCRRTCAPIRSSSAGPTSTCAASCRRPTKCQAFLASTDAGQARQADRRAAGAARIRRLLDAEMGGRAPQQPQDDPDQGHPRLSALAARARSTRTRRSTRWSASCSPPTAARSPTRRPTTTASPRDPQNLAETTAQLFFGIRMQCAKCHNHPFERWTQDDYYSMAAFFARVKQKKDTLEAGRDAADAGRRGHLLRSRRRSHPAAHRQGDGAEVHGRRRSRRSRPARIAAKCWPTG